jgi:hypothetical protein
MSDLVSKISASGLSAGVFLLWWPAHVTSQGGGVLLARGILWAAAFELLLLGFRPLERAIERAVRDRAPGELAPRRIGRVLALALVAAAVPAVLLAGARGTVAPARAAAPKVIVKREIVRREVVVRRVSHVVRVRVPVPAASATPPAATTAAAPTSVVRRTAATPLKRTSTTTQATAKAKADSGPTADPKSHQPAATSTGTTTSAPAATASTPQPSTTAPAASTAAAAPTSTVSSGR